MKRQGVWGARGRGARVACWVVEQLILGIILCTELHPVGNVLQWPEPSAVAWYVKLIVWARAYKLVVQYSFQQACTVSRTTHLRWSTGGKRAP